MFDGDDPQGTATSPIVAAITPKATKPATRAFSAASSTAASTVTAIYVHRRLRRAWMDQRWLLR